MLIEKRLQGRGNLSFTTINLVKLALDSKGDLDKFYDNLESIWKLLKTS